ncbi:hypothetical protein D3C72_1522990 [compost metagenome]
MRRRRRLVKPLQPPIPLAHAKIVDRQNVRTRQAVDQQHLHRPPPYPAQCHQPFDQRVVSHGQCLFPARHQAIQPALGNTLDRRHLARGKTTGAHGFWCNRQQLLRPWERSLREQRQQAPKNCLGSTGMQLLVGDRPYQHFVRLTPRRGLVQARPDRRDMPRPVRVERRQVFGGLAVRVRRKVGPDHDTSIKSIAGPA